MVRLQYVPVLRVARELYDIPRGGERFAAYLHTMVGADGELTLPLPMLNPMGKSPVADVLDALLALDAERIAQESLKDAAARCVSFADALRVSLVVADDAAGGWTNRWFSDAQHRFESKYFVRHGWAVALLWTSETATEETVRRAVIAHALAPHRATRSFPLIFAAFYGDDAARACGYDPLGVPPWGGFDLALAEAAAFDPATVSAPRA